MTFHTKLARLYSKNLFNCLRRFILISENNFQDETINKVNLIHLENIVSRFLVYVYYKDLIDYL